MPPETSICRVAEMAPAEELAETLRRFNLFADLDHTQLQAIADPDGERSFAAGERILRRGMSGTGFYICSLGAVCLWLDTITWTWRQEGRRNAWSGLELALHTCGILRIAITMPSQCRAGTQA